MRPDLYKKRGLSLIELLVSLVILSLITVMIFPQVRHFKQKTWRKEMKLQLSIYHKNWRSYWFQSLEGGDIATRLNDPDQWPQIQQFFRPVGVQFYNIGFGPKDSDNNTYDFCQDDFDGENESSPDCRFKCEPPFPPALVRDSFKESSTEKIIGYAYGDILTPKECNSPDTKIDQWKVLEDGTLEHMQDAL